MGGVRRLAWRALRRGVARLPYPLAARVSPALAWYESRIRSRLFHEVHEAVVRACVDVGLSEPPADAVDAALRRTVWNRLRAGLLSALARASDAALARWVVVDGRARLDGAREAKQGVILINSHFGAGRAVPQVLAQLGYRVSSLEGGDAPEKVSGRPDDGFERLDVGSQRSFRLAELQFARRTLQRGDCVHVLGDGRMGSSRLVLPFHGRLRDFRTGFAELALLTGAPAVPVFAAVDDRGRLRVEVQAALDPGPPAVGRPDRVAALVRQYVQRLEARWSAQPGEVFPHQLAVQRQCPPERTAGAVLEPVGPSRGA